MGYDDVGVVLLTCTDEPARARPGMHAVTVPARPERADLDPVLLDPDLRRLVVAGTDADLAAVLGRLLRTDRLGVELAYLPAARRSVAARLWGVPRGRAAVELARHGVAHAAPLVRDDAGGVLVGRAELRGSGGTLHGEAYCDGQLVLRGAARRLVVTPWPDAAPIRAPGTAPGADPVAEPAPAAVTVRAGRGGGVGRAVQVGCRPATVVHDGVAHPRAVTRWAWYRHVADWLLVRDVAR